MARVGTRGPRVEHGAVRAQPTAPAVLVAAHAVRVALAPSHHLQVDAQRPARTARCLGRPLARRQQRPLAGRRAGLARGGNGVGAALAEPLAVGYVSQRWIQAVRVHAQVAAVAQQHELLVLVGGTARAEYSIHREAPVECGEPASGINRSARTRLCWAGVGLRRVPAAAQRHPLCVLLHVTLQSDQDSGGVCLHHPRREPRSLRTLSEHEAAQV